MLQLPIPYRSQWDDDAGNHSADCGPTCVAMLLNYFDVEISPDGVYDHLPPKKPTEYTYVSELISAARANNVELTYERHNNQAEALTRLRAHLDAGRASIALVKYAPWREATGNNYEWGHFVVVTGYDDEHITFHDPLFGLWQPRGRGAHYTMSAERFCAGWGGFPESENPNWACTVAAPQPESDGHDAQSGGETPGPAPSDDEAALLTPELRRRIQAFAAYHRMAAPVWDDAAGIQAWLDHLGDWGREYDEHVVGAGETLSGIARDHFGDASRWPVIQAYNGLQRELLWIGERLRIPRIGTTGAPLEASLAFDTGSRGPLMESFGGPDRPALDYNAVGVNTAGIGFVHSTEPES